MWVELGVRIVKASRKPSRCIWCGEAIAVGGEKHVDTGKFDGEFQSNNYHPECFLASQDYFRVNGDEGFEAGSFARGGTYEKCEPEAREVAP